MDVEIVKNIVKNMEIIKDVVFLCLGTFLSVLLTKILLQNGRLLRRMEESFREAYKRAEQRHQEVIQMMKEADERTEKRHTEAKEMLKLIALLSIEQDLHKRKKLMEKLLGESLD